LEAGISSVRHTCVRGMHGVSSVIRRSRLPEWGVYEMPGYRGVWILRREPGA
jgi:hypothetical protein